MPSKSEIAAAYQELHNVKKAAKHLHTSQEYVSRTLREMGLLKTRKSIPPKEYHRCNTCANARADRCAFIRASVEKAESVLIAAGCEYTVKLQRYKYGPGWSYIKTVPVFTVLDCPKWECGGIATMP